MRVAIAGAGNVGLFIANDLEPNMVTVMQHRVMLPAEKRNAALAEECDAVLERLAEVATSELGSPTSELGRS